jgi:hypothetical protein
MRWIAALLGAVVGYFVVVYPSCTWFWPQSNLCGILFPVGSVVGAGFGFWFFSRGRRNL